jgi:hypothetical protein
MSTWTTCHGNNGDPQLLFTNHFSLFALGKVFKDNNGLFFRKKYISPDLMIKALPVKAETRPEEIKQEDDAQFYPLSNEIQVRC